MVLMTKQRIGHLLVLDGGALTGIGSIGDMVKYRLAGIKSEAEASHQYFAQA